MRVDQKYIGKGVFGKAYKVMFENDVHASGTVDDILTGQMVLLDEHTKVFLYNEYTPIQVDVKDERPFMRSVLSRLQGDSEKETVRKIIEYLSSFALNYTVDMEDMFFGGTEEAILTRGTDWCTDLSRVCAVMLQLAGIPSRIVNTVNSELAYNGHVVVEAYYEGKWGVVDPVFGVMMYKSEPLDAYTLKNDKGLARKCFIRDYKDMKDDFFPEKQYEQIAIVNYFANDHEQYNYTASTLNDYTRKILVVDHQGKWFMGEDL